MYKSSNSSIARSTASRTHALLIKSGSTDIYSWNKLLTAYSRCVGPIEAHKLFDEIPQRDAVSWNSLVASYVSHHHHEPAWDTLRTMMGLGVAFDQYTLGSVLKSVADAGHVELGRQLHAATTKGGFDGNVFAASALVDMYAKCHAMDHAHAVFELVPEPSVVTWNAVIAGYAQVAELGTVIRLLGRMERSEVAPDEATFASILTLMDRPHYKLMTQMHGKIVKHQRIAPEAIVFNAAITAYSQCGSVVDSEKVFDEMGDDRDLVSWNSMLAAYASNGLVDETIQLYVRMQEAGVDQDMYTFTSMLSACFEGGQGWQGRMLHALVVKRGLDRAISVSNALVAFYVRHDDGRMMEDAVRCFGRMEHKDSVSWNSILTGFSQRGMSEEALQFFVEMWSAHFTVDQYAFSAVLRSCSDLAVLQLGQQVHGLARKSGFDSNDFVGSSLIYLYSKCGVLEDAQCAFNEVNKESSVTWNSIIFGYAQHGLGKISLDIFQKMQELGVEPDHITFVGILSACSHIGLVEEGFNFLQAMETVYKIPLRMEHYACGVDLFGRAGRLHDAKRLIDSMPFEPDATVWMTLLGACRIHGDIELASHAARHVLVLEPREHSTYILLSNMYARFGVWDGRAMIQGAMRDRGVSKVPGCSWIEVKNKLHAFNAEDRCHPEAEDIYEKLESLLEEIETTPYVLISEAEMHDVESG